MVQRLVIATALGGTFLLGACASFSPDNPNMNRDQGAIVGAGLGAVMGNLIGGDTEATMLGAAVGGIAGGVIGAELDRQEADLRSSVGDGRVSIVNTGDRLIVTLPQDILFDTDSYSVRPALISDLQAVSGSLQRYPASTVQVIGHTDNTGDAGYNQSLSERRASAVANVLISSGTPAGRIVPVGRGENQPVASNLTDAGKAQNRRVEIVILPTA